MILRKVPKEIIFRVCKEPGIIISKIVKVDLSWAYVTEMVEKLEKAGLLRTVKGTKLRRVYPTDKALSILDSLKVIDEAM